MYKKVIQKGLIILLIILLGLLIYLIKLSYKENELISTGSTTTKIDTTSSTTSTVTTTTTSTTTTTTKAIELSDSIYAPYHIENYDNYSIDNITDADIQRVFTEKGAVKSTDKAFFMAFFLVIICEKDFTDKKPKNISTKKSSVNNM